MVPVESILLPPQDGKSLNGMILVENTFLVPETSPSTDISKAYNAALAIVSPRRVEGLND